MASLGRHLVCYASNHSTLSYLQRGLAGTSESASVQTQDLGMLVRLTPIHSLGRFVDQRGMLMELSFSLARHNDADAWLQYEGGARAPLGNNTRTGIGLHWALGISPGLRARFEQKGQPWLADAMASFYSVGLAYERTSEFATPQGYDTDRIGVEVVLANVLAVRYGTANRIHEPNGRSNYLSGGLGLRVPGVGGFRIDAVTTAGPTGQGASIYLNPEWIAQLVRGE